MKTDYAVVAQIQSQLDNPGKYGFMRAANALLEGNLDKGLLFRYMRDVFGLPKHLFGELLHHFYVAVGSEIAWRRRHERPEALVRYMLGEELPGMNDDKRMLDTPAIIAN